MDAIAHTIDQCNSYFLQENKKKSSYFVQSYILYMIY